MSIGPIDQSAMQVRWDAARERSVLVSTLARCERVARRRRAARWIVAGTAVLVLLRALPRLAARADDAGGFAGAAEPSGVRPTSSGHGGNAGKG
jgi:hypothetical protein